MHVGYVRNVKARFDIVQWFLWSEKKENFQGCTITALSFAVIGMKKYSDKNSEN